MGSFYANLVVRGPEADEILAALSGHDAFVSPTINRCTVIYDRKCDEQDIETLSELALGLSEQFDCPVLALLNHDDDVLWYRLYWMGELSDEYNSCPSYFEADQEPTGPEGGDNEKLCAAFASDETDRVETILRTGGSALGGYVFEMERHTALAAALQMPECSVGFGFVNIDSRDFPEGMAADQFQRATP